MEFNLIEILGNLGATVAGIAIALYFAYQHGKRLLDTHKEAIERVCDTHKEIHERSCEMFERALDRRDKDIQYLVNEIRAGNSSVIQPK